MSTVAARLFLDEDVELTVRLALIELKVPTLGRRQPNNGFQVVNIFDLGHLNEFVSRRFTGKEEAVLIAGGDINSDYSDTLFSNLIGMGIELQGITDPSQTNWQGFLKFYLLGSQNENEI
jgi:hypothetical protein